jgi:hypothetical protein
MKTIRLRVGKLKLVSLKSRKGEEKEAWMTVELGNALNIVGVQVGFEGGSFHQNLSVASLRFLDTPILHRKEENHMPLLEDIICEAICIFFKENAVRLRSLFEQGLNDLDLEEVNLKQNGSDLVIPIQFIKLKNFSSRHSGGDVRVDIQIGHHIIVWSVKIYNGNVFDIFDDNIKDPELRRVICRMIQNDIRLRDYVRYLSQRGIGDLGSGEEFIEQTEGCDPNSTPPPVKFC